MPGSKGCDSLQFSSFRILYCMSMSTQWIKNTRAHLCFSVNLTQGTWIPSDFKTDTPHRFSKQSSLTQWSSHLRKSNKQIVCQRHSCFPNIKLVYMYLATFLHHIENVTNSLFFHEYWYIWYFKALNTLVVRFTLRINNIFPILKDAKESL